MEEQMPDDRTVPILPCSDIDVMIAFYEALGFRCTYRQVKPNPHAVMERGTIGLHFGGFDGFEPTNSYGSCIVVTDDADALYADFAAGIRAKEGRLPVTGIPRFTRPRKKLDVVHGFSVVDPGGNWIRVVQRGPATEGGEEIPEKVAGLAKAVLTAARLGDAKGDTAQAASTLDRALAKFADAPATERVAALVYRAELALAMTEPAVARRSLAAARAIDLDASERDAVLPDLQRAAELEADLA
jgi:catechol 2,3-dioxygenase-like lactoylglutathione lyase family enzyme